MRWRTTTVVADTETMEKLHATQRDSLLQRQEMQLEFVSRLLAQHAREQQALADAQLAAVKGNQPDCQMNECSPGEAEFVKPAGRGHPEAQGNQTFCQKNVDGQGAGNGHHNENKNGCERQTVHERGARVQEGANQGNQTSCQMNAQHYYIGDNESRELPNGYHQAARDVNNQQIQYVMVQSGSERQGRALGNQTYGQTNECKIQIAMGIQNQSGSEQGPARGNQTSDQMNESECINVQAGCAEREGAQDNQTYAQMNGSECIKVQAGSESGAELASAPGNQTFDQMNEFECDTVPSDGSEMSEYHRQRAFSAPAVMRGDSQHEDESEDSEDVPGNLGLEGDSECNYDTFGSDGTTDMKGHYGIDVGNFCPKADYFGVGGQLGCTYDGKSDFGSDVTKDTVQSGLFGGDVGNFVKNGSLTCSNADKTNNFGTGAKNQADEISDTLQMGPIGKGKGPGKGKSKSDNFGDGSSKSKSGDQYGDKDKAKSKRVLARDKGKRTGGDDKGKDKSPLLTFHVEPIKGKGKGKSRPKGFRVQDPRLLYELQKLAPGAGDLSHLDLDEARSLIDRAMDAFKNR